MGTDTPITERNFACLTFAPSRELVPAASNLVSQFCGAVVADRDTAWRFYMAAQELAENLIKYSTGSPVTLEVELESRTDAPQLRLTARNRTSPERLEEIARRLSELKQSPNPTALYDRLAQENAPKPGVSGLGLVRIRAEGDLHIDYTIEGNELTILVHAPVEIREKA